MSRHDGERQIYAMQITTHSVRIEQYMSKGSKAVRHVLIECCVKSLAVFMLIFTPRICRSMPSDNAFGVHEL